MDSALIASVALMGLAGAPHCAAMCGAPCAAITRGPGPALWSWLFARLLSYALAGAVVCASVGAWAALTPALPALRSLWVLVHAGAVALGLWLLVMGRWPAWAAWTTVQGLKTVHVVHLRERPRPSRAFGVGGLWALMPCGLLQSALLVAALANTPSHAALAMAAFALASSAGPALAPQLLARWGGFQGRSLAGPTRWAGALLAAASIWALAHGVWQQVLAWCA